MLDISIYLSDTDRADFKDYRRLHSFVESEYVDGKENFVLIDEIQMCDGFKKSVKQPSRARKISSICDGSNAFLLRRNYHIYSSAIHDAEIDFMAMRRNGKVNIQVCRPIDDEKTFERELKPFFKIRDAYPKLLISRTKQTEYQYEGIRIMDIVDWLLSGRLENSVDCVLYS